MTKSWKKIIYKKKRLCIYINNRKYIDVSPIYCYIYIKIRKIMPYVSLRSTVTSIALFSISRWVNSDGAFRIFSPGVFEVWIRICLVEPAPLPSVFSTYSNSCCNRPPSGRDGNRTIVLSWIRINKPCSNNKVQNEFEI